MGLFQKVVFGGTLVAFAAPTPATIAQQPIHTGLRSATSDTQVGADPIYAPPADTPEGVLQDMTSRAAVIFTGTVITVNRVPDTAVVEIAFAVESAVRGATAGSTYTLREWSGLWHDSPRFVTGQRLLMLLHAPNAGGLSSPVDGLDGAIPIKAATSDSSLSALASTAPNDAQQPQDTVDLRWLQAKTLRSPVAATDAPTSNPGESFAGGLTLAPSLAPAASAAPIAASATLTHVLGLLKSFLGTANASH